MGFVTGRLRRGPSRMGWTCWYLVDREGRLLNMEPVCSTPDGWHEWFEEQLGNVTTEYIGVTDDPAEVV